MMELTLNESKAEYIYLKNILHIFSVEQTKAGFTEDEL